LVISYSFPLPFLAAQRHGSAAAERRPLETIVELSRYRGRIFPSPFMANIET
jgi:hypothetical protein